MTGGGMTTVRCSRDWPVFTRLACVQPIDLSIAPGGISGRGDYVANGLMEALPIALGDPQN